MEHLFISYSRRNEKYVSAVSEGLRSRGIEVWQDISGKTSGIPYSTKWFEVIQEALFNSAGAVIFKSREWEDSDPCKKEFALIEALDIPYIEVVIPADGEGMQAQDAVNMISEWSAGNVYNDPENMDRVWMLSMVRTQRSKYGQMAGIPHFGKRKDSKQFLDRLERCRRISEERDFPERLEKCHRIVEDKDNTDPKDTDHVTEYPDEIESFLKKARRITIADLLRRPLTIAAIILLLTGSVAVNWIYSRRDKEKDRNLEALISLEQVRDILDEDEQKALSIMGEEDLEFGKYVTLLYETYAEVLSREFPAKTCKAGTEEAQRIVSLPEQTGSEGFTVEPSERSGVVRVFSDPKEDEVQRMIALSVADAPDDWAVLDGYLAVTAGKHAYVYDMERGTAAVELHGLKSEGRRIRFDESGNICVLTDSGEALIWENPIRRMGCAASEVPQMPADSRSTTEQVSQNRKIRIIGEADGMIRAFDTAGNCVIWQCAAVTEPIENLLLQEDTWNIYAQGRSGSWYRADASDVLTNYNSKDADGQRERYRQLGEHISERLTAE